MTLTEEILEHIRALPEPLQAEVLNFVQYVESKIERSGKGQEETDWSILSLSLAMRGIENEPALYSTSDLKERFL